jgi:glutamyl-tRNA synthetase
MMRPFLERAGLLQNHGSTDDKLKQIAAAAGDRIKVAGDILDYSGFFQSAEQLTYDEAAFQKRVQDPPEAAGLLQRFAARLERLENFDAVSIETELQDFVQEEGIGHAQIIHALRVATTGKAVGFGLFDSLAILGRRECLDRIQRALERCSSASGV